MTQQPAPPPVALGLSGLRSYVSMCCLIIMFALGVQILVWSLVTFTDLRFKVLDAAVQPATIVHSGGAAARQPARGASQGLPPEIQAAITPGPIKVRSGFDHLFSDLTTLSVATGSLALIILVLLLIMAANLMTASVMSGVDRAISALIWAIIVTVLALPTAGVLGLPWKGSALRPYASLVQQVEAAQGRGEGLSFYASFLIMPGLCLLGMIVIECRFRSAVRRNLPDANHPFLDPALEREASNVKATSLHGARSSASLDRLVAASRDRELCESVAAQASRKPTEQAPSSNENCRRLI